MGQQLTLESEEWYVLCNWLRERENRLMYALRSRSPEWEFVHDLRREIEGRGERRAVGGRDPQSGVEDPNERREAGARHADRETDGGTRTVSLSDGQVAYLSSFLRRRARKLLLFPWRSRERRDVRHLRDHLLAEAGRNATGRQRFKETNKFK